MIRIGRQWFEIVKADERQTELEGSVAASSWLARSTILTSPHDLEMSRITVEY